jgi:hypothetical protein
MELPSLSVDTFATVRAAHGQPGATAMEMNTARSSPAASLHRIPSRCCERAGSVPPLDRSLLKFFPAPHSACSELLPLRRTECTNLSMWSAAGNRRRHLRMSALRPVELRSLHGSRRHLCQLNEDCLVELREVAITLVEQLDEAEITSV